MERIEIKPKNKEVAKIELYICNKNIMFGFDVDIPMEDIISHALTLDGPKVCISEYSNKMYGIWVNKNHDSIFKGVVKKTRF